MLTKRKRGKTYHADLLVGRIHKVRGPLGTRNEDAANALIRRIDLALAQGPSSDLWGDLYRVLPAATYLRFAKHAGVKEKPLTTWIELRERFEGDLEDRLTINDISESSVLNYQRILDLFDRFLNSRDKPVPLIREIDKDVAREFKYHRIRAIQAKRGPTAGAGYRSEVAVLHRVFAFAVEKSMTKENPFQYEPKLLDLQGGAQPFSGPELLSMRQHAGKDLLLYLVSGTQDLESRT